LERSHYQAGLSYAQVGRALGVPKSMIGKIVSLARAANVD
jgi:DNA-directed RNA polymerase specialized sigma24 family protein